VTIFRIKEMTMKLGCSTWSYHRAFERGAIDIFGFVDICADDLKLDGVELLDRHLDAPGVDFLTVKNYIVRRGLAVSCVSASNNFGYLSEEKLEGEVEKVKRWIDITKIFGAPIIRVFAGWEGAAPWDEEFGTERIEKGLIWPGMVRCMKECVEYGRVNGVILALENHNHRGLVHTREDAEKILKEVDSVWFGLNLDTAGYTEQEWNDVHSVDYDAFENTLQSALQVHLKIISPGKDRIDTVLDYDRIFDILVRKDYRGFLSLEYDYEEEFEGVPSTVSLIKKKL
jgi:sugar phosphate isomerase/epimerase